MSVKSKVAGFSMKKKVIACAIAVICVGAIIVLSVSLSTREYMTKDKYTQLTEKASWSSMTVEKMNDELNMHGKYNKEESEKLGDNYKVYEYKTKNGEDKMTVTFMKGSDKNDKEEYKATSLNITSGLL